MSTLFYFLLYILMFSLLIIVRWLWVGIYYLLKRLLLSALFPNTVQFEEVEELVSIECELLMRYNKNESRITISFVALLFVEYLLHKLSTEKHQNLIKLCLTEDDSPIFFSSHTHNALKNLQVSAFYSRTPQYFTVNNNNDEISQIIRSNNNTHT